MGKVIKRWNKDEIDWIIKNYPKRGKVFCSKYLGRTESSIRSKVTELRLKSLFKFNEESNYNRGSSFRGKKRPEHSKLLKDRKFIPADYFTTKSRKINSEKQKKLIQNGKPVDNFLGHHHTKESKKKISKAIREKWQDKNYICNSEEYRQMVSDRSSKFQQNNPTLNRYSRGNGQRIKIANKEYWFRSSWEVIYAKYLQFLLEKKEIKKWEYEADTFWFERIKRGVRSYKPDFKITNNNGSIEYHEVKGWMDSKSKTKIKRMALYYPEIKLIIIDSESIKAIKKWERLFNN